MGPPCYTEDIAHRTENTSFNLEYAYVATNAYSTLKLAFSSSNSALNIRSLGSVILSNLLETCSHFPDLSAELLVYIYSMEAPTILHQPYSIFYQASFLGHQMMAKRNKTRLSTLIIRCANNSLSKPKRKSRKSGKVRPPPSSRSI